MVISICPEALIYARRDTPPTTMIFSPARTDRDRFTNRLLDGPLARAEPKTLRYRLLHPAARLVRGQRKRKIKIPHAWPWARELEACFQAVFALPAPT